MKKSDALVVITSLLITAFSHAAQAFGQQTSEQQIDPLIAKGGETTVFIGTLLIIIAIAALVGALSRRIEHAVFTALGLSLIPIALFFLSR
jgi:hypothetical protein